MEDPPDIDPEDDPKRIEPALDTIIPDNPSQSYDMKDVIRSIVDKGEFFEPHEFFASNIIVCFARLNGKSIGIIANQPMVLAGCLEINAFYPLLRFFQHSYPYNR